MKKELPEYPITVLGPSGVGKTSMLTGMYETFKKIVSQIEISIDPESATLQRIQNCLIQLKSLTKKSNNILVRPGQGVGGTGDPFSFYFNMGVKGKKSSLKLCFQDYPGGWINSNPQQMKRVVNFVKESVAVLIPIDATAIMEKNGEYHELVNLPTIVTDLIGKAYKELDSPRLVILAPIKCETYMGNEDSAKKLLQRVNQEYEILINFLKTPALRSNVAVVVTPIQTVGNVIFSKIDEDENGLPRFYFRRKAGGYAPKDCEQPLKYLLQFILKLYTQRGNWLTKFFRGFFELDQPFLDAAAIFARQPFNPNCKVLQGDQWFNINN